jgi:uncharacterized membrane protein
MNSWKTASSMILYCLALGMSAVGTLWIVYVHLDLWREGKFIFGPFVVLVVIEYVLVSLVAWAFARWLHGRKPLDIAFGVLTAIPFILLVVIRSQDWTG